MTIPGIYIAAGITSVIAAVQLVVIIRYAQPAERRRLWTVAALTLPMQPLAFYLVRVPLDRWLISLLGTDIALYVAITTLYAPLTEEPAKLIALLIPLIRRDIRLENFVRYALAIGISFAIGEMWFVAERVTHQPELVDLPFYQFMGYVIERLMTCVLHSAFAAISLWLLHRKFVLGLVGAMSVHWLGNIPIFLMAWNVGGLGRDAWAGLVQLWLVGAFIAALALLSCFSFGRFSLVRMIYGRRKCPECKAEYDPPILFAVNFGPTRYERCPNCKRWHWTTTSRSSSPAETAREV